MTSPLDSDATSARYAGLIRVSEALRTYHDRETLFRCLAQELRPLVRFDFLGVALYDEVTRVVTPFVLEATGETGTPPTLTSPEQLTYWVLHERRPLVILDVRQEPRFGEEMGYLHSQGMVAGCCLPLLTPQRPVGMLLFGSREPHAYPEADVAFLSLVANQVALAVDDTLNYGALQASLALERDRLQTLATSDALLHALVPTLDVRQVFEQVSAIARTVLPHDMVSLPLISDDGEHLIVHAVSGNASTFPARVPLPAHHRRLLTDPWEYLLVPDLQADPLERATPPGAAGYRGRLAVPIRIEGRLVGVFDVLSFQPNCYTTNDVLVARRIADHLTLALSHQRLAEEAQRAAEARERAALLERRVTALMAEVDALGGHRRVIGESPAWRQVLKQATQVAGTDTTVLLLGESGTGKEVVARFLHRASGRSSGPFVALNCAALPEPLLESELFGFERGAFTGAMQAKPGHLEQAAGGVLFLDEVGEMSLPVQAKVLRVLQEREFQRLGGTRVLKANVRVVAATNRDLRSAVERRVFREDLYYRLNVFAIRLPPLRERPDDILPLCHAFLRDIAGSLGRPPAGLAHEAVHQLVTYRWPGNVRELRNVMERASILCEGGLIASEHITFITDGVSAGQAPTPTAERDPNHLHSIERSLIERALVESRHNKSLAAERLGLSRKQLYVRLRKYGIQ
jgi:transcriptional regulator with GAF, ATPase, and Fis domain